jgi:hypothetical protein
VVLAVGLEMFGQICDAGTENGNLDFGGSGVGVALAILLDEFLFFLFRNHFVILFRLYHAKEECASLSGKRIHILAC